MSTSIYLECRGHTPPIVADSESGQHLYDLDPLRTLLAHRKQVTDAHRILTEAAGGYIDYGERYLGNSIRFMAKHPECPLGIIDEYGQEHPLEDPDGE